MAFQNSFQPIILCNLSNPGGCSCKQDISNLQSKELRYIRDQLINLLQEIRDHAQQHAVIEVVVELKDTLYGPYAHRAPDLLLQWNEFDITQSVSSPTLGEFRPQDHRRVLDYRTGDHNQEAAIYYNDRFATLSNIGAKIHYTELASIISSLAKRMPG